MSITRFVLSLLVLAPLLVAGWAGSAEAQRPEIFQSGRSTPEVGVDLAVGGYDTVAYHTQRMPVLGRPEFRVMWKEAEWRFASKENLDLFVADPERYAPQYGGYCAWAVAHGGLSPGDPRFWSIVDGRLYLNLNASVQSQWNRDQSGLITRANQRWPAVLGR